MDQLSFDDVEIWKPVVGYEGLYEVSSLGHVRSLPRNGTLGGILRPQRKRYLTVNLWRNGKMRTVTIHKLVARAFLGLRPEGQQVCHGPAGGFENALTNLSYGTPAKNLGPDKYRDGTMQAGVRNGNAKLTDELVAQIRVRIAAGESRGAVARELGMSRYAIGIAAKGATWRHVPVLPLPSRPTPQRNRFAFVQLAAHLESLIKNGDMAAGSKLPSLRVLAAQYGVGATTAFKAVEILRTAGLVSAKGIPEPFVLPPDERAVKSPPRGTPA